jgi:hypothetical protein
MMGAMNQGMKEMSIPPGAQQNQQNQQNFPPPMETRGIRKEMRGPNIDPRLFNNTPLASNYPAPPPPMTRNGVPPPPPRPVYYDENPINDDDRFSIASSDDSSVSTVSLGSTVKTLNVGMGKKKNARNGGLELNIK